MDRRARKSVSKLRRKKEREDETRITSENKKRTTTFYVNDQRYNKRKKGIRNLFNKDLFVMTQNRFDAFTLELSIGQTPTSSILSVSFSI